MQSPNGFKPRLGTQKQKARSVGRNNNSSQKVSADIRLFNDDAFLLSRSEFDSGDDENTITKRALVMVEGQHTDSAKRKHFFSSDRVAELVENTNALLNSGGRVPWQRDHKKDQDSNIGDLEGLLELRVITLDDVPDPRLIKKLVGKVGAFATKLVAKGKDVVDQIVAGRISTLSPGIDIATNTIREISATPTPAIIGLRTFRRHDGSANFALTFEEAEAEQADVNANKKEYQKITDTFWNIVSSIASATEDQLQGQDSIELQYEAVNEMASRLIEMLGLEATENSSVTPTEPQPNAMKPKGIPMPDYLQKQKSQLPPGGKANMSAYTMADMAKLMYSNGSNAEFAKGRKRGSRNRKRKSGLRDRIIGKTVVGRAARLAALAGAGAAVRYGGAGLGYSKTFGRGKDFNAGNALRKVGVGALGKVRSDISNAGYEVTRNLAGLRAVKQGMAPAAGMVMQQRSRSSTPRPYDPSSYRPRSISID